ncbi:MAG: CAP domain-containing protein [Chloroflexi bacterium]|nr:CAP domain-containing protein [Chloroflexota bacterium]
MGKTSELHKLLNRERTKRGLTYTWWNQDLWHGCKSHCNYMLRTKHLVHADISEIPNGGECICGGKGNHSPRTIVKSWMNSPGHSALILSPNIRSHAVAILDGKYGTYATWRGSQQTIHIPSKPIKIPSPFRIFMRRKLMPTNPFKVGLSLVLGVIGLLGMAMGIHGVYVYFNRLDLILGGEGSKLFLAIDVPIRLRDLVMWSSARGLQSWIIPVLIFVAGLWIFNYSRLWTIISRFLDKARP